MKLIIFAGGTGTRLWPLSRVSTPKQFEKIFEGKSTIQLMVERLEKFGFENVFISTNKKYVDLLKEQLPEIPEENFFLEPAKRDLAPAVGLTFMKLQQKNVDESIAILWADSLINSVSEFQNAIGAADELIQESPNRLIYFAEKPRFANHNLGWITVGKKLSEKNGFNALEFKGWKYRPELELCKTMFAEGNAFWNPGYFVTSVNFIIELYKKHMPEMYSALEKIINNPSALNDIYPTLESISFDDAIVEKTTSDQALVLKVEMGWSDPGTLYALKEALTKSTEENATKGNVVNLDTTDSLIYNDNPEQLVATIGLDGFLIVNTKDAIFVCHKNNVPRIKELLKTFKGSELEKYL